MKNMIENDGMLMLENTQNLGANGSSYTFRYHSENDGEEREDKFIKEDGGNRYIQINEEQLKEYDKIATFLGDEGGINIYYNSEEKEFYLCEINADRTSSDLVNAYDLFKDKVLLDEGCVYTISFYSGTVHLQSSDVNAEFVKKSDSGYYGEIHSDDYFNADRTFTDEFFNSLKAMDISQSNTIISNGTTEDTPVESIKVEYITSSVESVQASEVETTANNALTIETTVAPTEPVSSTEKHSSNGGMLAAIISLGFVAAAAIAGCVLLYKKYNIAANSQKASTGTKNRMSNRYKEVNEENEELEKKNRELENAIKSIGAENETLRGQLAATNEQLETYKKQNIGNSNMQQTEQQWQAECDRLKQEVKRERDLNVSYVKENNQLKENNRILENRIRELDGKNQELIEEIRKLEVMNQRNSEPDDLRICLSTEVLQKYRDVRFLAVNVSVAGSVTLSEAPYKRAPIAMIENKAYLNPYFFQDLPKNRESYNNLVVVRSVYEINGLKGSALNYGLHSIIPAELAYDSSAGGYTVAHLGKLDLIN